MTGSRGVRRTSVLRLATEPTKAAFCITAFFDVNHSSLLAFQGLRLAVPLAACGPVWVYKNSSTRPQTVCGQRV